MLSQINSNLAEESRKKKITDEIEVERNLCGSDFEFIGDNMKQIKK
jgi:hypothetical protein